MSYTVLVTIEEGDPVVERQFTSIMYGSISDILKYQLPKAIKREGLHMTSITSIEIHERKFNGIQ